ncbi:hypothetical protein SELMODRAFT_421711 [Selaginella moellendorffii]|uniref:Uncharacterized protein n=1 Tax=Selaginella moellendorffii TaxID=88036 RepID=D8SG49_SELML|nr:hypothetical protein SELMODRAFT_421711 [Selaginella moellendorffii]
MVFVLVGSPLLLQASGTYLQSLPLPTTPATPVWINTPVNGYAELVAELDEQDETFPMDAGSFNDDYSGVAGLAPATVQHEDDDFELLHPQIAGLVEDDHELQVPADVTISVGCELLHADLLTQHCHEQNTYEPESAAALQQVDTWETIIQGELEMLVPSQSFIPPEESMNAGLELLPLFPMSSGDCQSTLLAFLKKMKGNLYKLKEELDLSTETVPWTFLLAPYHDETRKSVGVGSDMVSMAGMFGAALIQGRVFITKDYHCARHKGCNRTWELSRSLVAIIGMGEPWKAIGPTSSWHIGCIWMPRPLLSIHVRQGDSQGNESSSPVSSGRDSRKTSWMNQRSTKAGIFITAIFEGKLDNQNGIVYGVAWRQASV